MDALKEAKRFAKAVVGEHKPDDANYVLAFYREMRQDAELLAAIAQAEAMTRIAVALEMMADGQADMHYEQLLKAHVAERAEERADTESLRAVEREESVILPAKNIRKYTLTPKDDSDQPYSDRPYAEYWRGYGDAMREARKSTSHFDSTAAED